EAGAKTEPEPPVKGSSPSAPASTPQPQGPKPAGSAPTPRTGCPNPQGGGAPKRHPKLKSPAGPRKRLYSYVPPGLKPHAPRDSRDGGPQHAKDKETEQAATKLFKAFIDSKAPCRSVEDQDLGYDFVVAVAGRELCVEVKGSRDRWVNWEHALTPNE